MVAQVGWLTDPDLGVHVAYREEGRGRKHKIVASVPSIYTRDTCRQREGCFWDRQVIRRETSSITLEQKDMIDKNTELPRSRTSEPAHGCSQAGHWLLSLEKKTSLAMTAIMVDETVMERAVIGSWPWLQQNPVTRSDPIIVEVQSYFCRGKEMSGRKGDAREEGR